MAMHERARAMLVLAVALACAGCSGGAGGVGVQTVDTNVIFHAAQASTSTTAPGQATPGAALPTFPPLPPLPPLAFPTFRVIGPQAARCPSASPYAQPGTVADAVVNTSPSTGAYSWVGTGADSNVVSGVTITLPVLGFAHQYLRRVKPFTDPLQVPALQSAPSDDFTFDTMMPNYSLAYSGLDDLLWQVKSNSSTPNDPLGGLALMGVDIVNANGSTATPTVAPFSPPAQQGLLMLPLPVDPTKTWTSTVADTNGAVWQLAGSVAGRENVDECGTLVQAWHVHATLTVTSTGSGTSGTSTTLDYDVATQYGASVVALKISGPWMGATFANATFRDGQVTPDPLPSNIGS